MEKNNIMLYHEYFCTYTKATIQYGYLKKNKSDR